MDDNMHRMLAELRIGQKLLRQEMERSSPLQWVFILGGIIMVLLGLPDLF